MAHQNTSALACEASLRRFGCDTIDCTTSTVLTPPIEETVEEWLACERRQGATPRLSEGGPLNKSTDYREVKNHGDRRFNCISGQGGIPLANPSISQEKGVM